MAYSCCSLALEDCLEIALLTDTGRLRPHNEDCAIADPGLRLLVVADGMGGHEAGEVASALAVDVIRERVGAGQDLEHAILAAHDAIISHPQGRGERAMGTTVVAVRYQEHGSYQAAWVGDSRIYQLRTATASPALVQVSHDHTPVQEMVDMGLLTRTQARFHDQRNIISQALGVSPMSRPQVSLASGQLSPGDILLLCSDGLNGEIEDDVIQVLLQGPGSLETLARHLVDAALVAGGRDNITVLLARP